MVREKLKLKFFKKGVKKVIVLVVFLTVILTIAAVGLWLGVIAPLFDVDPLVQRIVVIVLIVVAVLLVLLSIITLKTEVETLRLTVVRSEVQKNWYLVWGEDENGNVWKIDFSDDDVFARLREGDIITAKLVKLDSRFGVIHDQFFKDVEIVSQSSAK